MCRFCSARRILLLALITLASGCAHALAPRPLHPPQYATTTAARPADVPTPLTIHGHPQKASYASPAEWPFLSAQCHPLPANTETHDHIDAFGTFNPQLGHAHVEWSLPIYAEVGAPLVVHFTIKLFHAAGRVTNIWGSPVRNIRWDVSGIEETGSEITEVIIGDPLGLVTRSGTLTIDPTLTTPVYAPVPRGWIFADLAVRVSFDTGVRLDAHILSSLYSVVDPQAAETPPLTSTHPNLQSNCQVIGPSDTNSPFGSAVSEYRSYIPLAPISAVYPLEPIEYNYGGTILGGRFQERLDPDLHHGIVGALLAEATTDDQGRFLGPLPTGLDPAVLGQGVHHVSTIWQQSSGAGASNVAPNEESWALLVIPVDVTTAPQPILVCEDPKADNLGKLLPCTYLLPPARLPASPDGTTIPPALQVVDSVGVVWTIVPATQEVQRNGGSSNGGFGSTVTFKGGAIFTLGLDAVWYQWWDNRGWLPGTPPQ